MPLPQREATTPRRWFRRPNRSLRFTTTVLPGLLTAVFIFAAGCVDAADSPETDDEALSAEAERRTNSADEPVEVIDDERSVERRIRDASVEAKIRTALVDADDLRRFNFDPVVVNGRVMLRGEVETQEQRRRAEQIAEGVDGVRSIVNEVAATEEPTPEEPAEDPMLAGGTDTTETEGAPESTDQPDDEADVSEPSQGESAAEDEAVHHTVSSGESLWTISRRHGVSIDQIRRLNNLGTNSTLRPGQRLRIK